MDYYALLVALVIVTAILFHGTREHNRTYAVVASALLFLIFGLRNTYVIGVDTTSSYLRQFRQMAAMSYSGAAQIGGWYNAGYYLLCRFCYTLTGGDYQLYITLIAAFVTFSFGRFIYRYSPNPLQSILYHFGLLFFTFHFSALKQSLAMSVLLFAFDDIFRPRPGKFILVTLLAALFHFPALVFLPAYWIAKLYPDKRFLFLLGVALLISFLFRAQIVEFMLNAYGEDEAEISAEGVDFFRTKSIIMIIILVSAYVLRPPSEDSRVYNTLLEFMGIAIVFQTFCGFSNIFERLADYYFQFSVVFIPMVFDRKVRNKLLLDWRILDFVKSIGPFLFCGYAIYRFLTEVWGNNMLFPYKFFFTS